tara:strand:+ start:2807 stop:3265 length:459 start_codon:yes stop_codon:yes gene_type:complete
MESVWIDPTNTTAPIEETVPTKSLQEELVELAQRAQKIIPGNPSRLLVTVQALRYFLSVWDKSYTGEGVPLEFTRYGQISDAGKLLRAARDMGDWGFTLDELIAAAGPELVMHPRSYKNSLSRFLRESGFTRKQVRRDGERPLVWFSPQGEE